jgi:hypothetical protein
MDKPWHILRVVSGTERTVAMRLGLPAYVPHRLHTSFNRRHRRVTEKLLPALPGMIFIRVPDPRAVGVISPGVLGWMRDGTRAFISLTQQDYKDMRRLEADVWCAERRPVSEGPVHRVGDRITFKGDHVFGGHDAIIERLRGNRALFQLLSNGLVIEADLAQVA